MAKQPSDSAMKPSDVQRALKDATRGSLRAFVTRLQSGTQSQEDLDVLSEILEWWSTRPRAMALTTRFREAGKGAEFFGDEELAAHLVAVADHLQGDVNPALLALVGKTLLGARIQDRP